MRERLKSALQSLKSVAKWVLTQDLSEGKRERENRIVRFSFDWVELQLVWMETVPNR